MLAITAELNARLADLLSNEHFGPPPKETLRKIDPASVYIGRATKEQQALALLYDEVIRAHKRMHEVSGEAMGINPRVSFDHYRLHVLQPVLFEMLKWSVHRAYPEQKTDLAIRFDDNWNMYAVPKPAEDKKEDGPVS